MKRPERIAKPILFILLALPIAALVYGVFTEALGANPIERILHETGEWGLRLLVATLAVTPLRQWTGWNWLIRIRRLLGLYAFFYVTMHFTTYLWLDQSFDWPAIIADIIDRPYISVGFAALCVLAPLAITSTDGMVRWLGGRRWRLLHRGAYIATILACLHFIWLVKADLAEPLIYATLTAVLLLARIPRRRAATVS
ncbi:MAG: sulfoxide reductase heme-binding subunit YedZ [Gammaproteobacteria bacterium]|nr:sulfoxide reductase heme-binding subunit YedZ [Gammaproteobacteria bacterium]